MAERTGVAQTLAVAAGVALLCSLLVSTAVYWLRPMQLAYAEIDRNGTILEAAGLIPFTEPASDREVAARFVELEARLFDRETGRFTTAIDPLTYDYLSARQDPSTTRELPADRDTAGIGRIARFLPLYMSPANGRVVIPIYGRGMWSTIDGFLALESDLDTIAGLAFHTHGETPGIGDRIEGQAWRAEWEGKRAYAADGTVALSVDAITGATVTSTAVVRLARFWLGPDGYGPALERLGAEGSP